jgi:hypothetical protein
MAAVPPLAPTEQLERYMEERFSKTVGKLKDDFTWYGGKTSIVMAMPNGVSEEAFGVYKQVAQKHGWTAALTPRRNCHCGANNSFFTMLVHGCSCPTEQFVRYRRYVVELPPPPEDEDDKDEEAQEKEQEKESATTTTTTTTAAATTSPSSNLKSNGCSNSCSCCNKNKTKNTNTKPSTNKNNSKKPTV